MKHIYLIRHGNYSNPKNILPGRLPVPLSKIGIEQAGKLAKYFKSKDIEKIYSSAVERCKQTSEIISEGNIPIEYDKRLLELHSAYQGFQFESVYDIDWKEFYKHRPYLGGENYMDVRSRALNFWEELIMKDFHRVIICTHGDSLHGIYQTLIDQEYLDDLSEAPDDYQKEASIREIVVSKTGEVDIKPMILNEQLK